MDLSKSKLNINHLKMIYTIAQSETVKDAAESLFITQPALTNRIREAERRLHCNLFVRRGRKLTISTAGKRLLHSARKILDELSRAEYDIARLSDGIEQVLRIGLPHYASFDWLPSAVNYFQKELPKTELEIAAVTQPLHDLFNGDIDIAMISSSEKKLNLNSDTYESLFLLQDELLACLSTQHEKAKKKYLLAEDFSDETYITNSIVPEKDREYELFFKPANVLPRKVVQVGFNEAIIELVKVNMGLTIFSKRMIETYLKNNDIKTIKLGKRGLKIYWHMVFLKKEQIATPAKLLANILKKHTPPTNNR